MATGSDTGNQLEEQKAIKPATIALVLLLASLVNMVPLFIYYIGSDISFHINLIDCVSTQIWQGDFYPAWCFNANNGLGSPTFMFYLPLPYYVSALLNPLRSFGVSIYDIFKISCLFATLMTAATCFSWLRDIVKPKHALLGTLLFLFMPYRNEAIFYRVAFVEMWAIAWMPLVFKYTRRLAKGDKSALAPLAFSFGLLFFSHVPCLIVAVMGSGLYLLIMTGRAWLPKCYYALSLLWGAAIAVWYLLPSMYYAQFLAPMNAFGKHFGWSNTYVNIDALAEERGRILILMVLTVILISILFLYVYRKRSRIGDTFVQREIIAWGVISATALFMLFRFSAPVYALMGPFAKFAFPWRMQNIFGLCATFLIVVWMEWLASPRQRKTMSADWTMFTAVLALASYLLVIAFDNEADFNKSMESAHTILVDINTKWTDVNHYSREYIQARATNPPPARADITSGKGSVEVRHWGWDGIELKTQADEVVTVRLDHLYFPVWYAQLEDGQNLPLYPEEETGQILVDVPPDEHTVTFHYSISRAIPWLVYVSRAVSVLAILLLLFQIRPKATGK